MAAVNINFFEKSLQVIFYDNSLIFILRKSDFFYCLLAISKNSLNVITLVGTPK